MSYIAVDLKVIEGLAGQVARAADVSEDRILAGLVRLWHRCWSTTSDMVAREHLAGVLGGGGLSDIITALVSNGFLEPRDDLFRVRGAARYLRLKAARAAGAAKTNAARSKSVAPERSRASLSDAQATLPDALSPSTEHRAPNPKRLAPARAVADPRLKPLTERLVAVFQAVRRSAYAHGGAKDAQALKRLLPVATDDEIAARWRRGLEAQGWASCSTFAQLSSKWNDLGPPPGSRPVEQYPPCAVCGGSAPAMVWGVALCHSCAASVPASVDSESASVTWAKNARKGPSLPL